MSEILEGVLSETMLDELASDLGMEHEALRKHPFFRVLKGRVILTYPLKSYSRIFQFQHPDTLAQLSPVTNTWYQVFNQINAKVLYVVVGHDRGVNHSMEVKVTADAVVLSGAADGGTLVTETDYYIHLDPTYLGAEALGFSADRIMLCDQESLEGDKVSIEIRDVDVIGAGKTIFGAVYWEQIE